MDAPIGINKLRNTIKDMTCKAGIEGHFTNHSLHSTSATRMYQAGIEEQVITEVTGHRSLAVWSYKKTDESQKHTASSALVCLQAKKFCPQWHYFGEQSWWNELVALNCEWKQMLDSKNNLVEWKKCLVNFAHFTVKLLGNKNPNITPRSSVMFG